MKAVFLGLVFLSTFAPTALSANESRQISGSVGPEYVGMFEAILDGRTVPLERQVPRAKVKVKALGIAGGRSEIIFQGERSTIRFPSRSHPEFLVRVGSQNVDPVNLVQFYVLDARKGQRILVIKSVGAIGVGSNDKASAAAIQFIARKHGSNFFALKSIRPLISGEYVLSTTDGRDGFMFAID